MVTGRLARDPELLKKGDVSYCNFTLAVDRPASKGKERIPNWLRITAFGNQAETLCKYMSKGALILVEGRIQSSQYEKDGKPVYAQEIIANRIEFLSQGKRRESEPAATDAQPGIDAPTVEPEGGDPFAEAEDDIPF